MVFVSLEGVVAAQTADKGRSAQTPIRVVVTPGSAAKCGGATGAPVPSSNRLRRLWRGQPATASHFVCFITDSVVHHKWVIVKPAADCAALRRVIARTASECKQVKSKNGCSCRRILAAAKAKPAVDKQSKAKISSGSSCVEARAVEQLINSFLCELFDAGSNSACKASVIALDIMERFLDVEAHRTEAVDRIVRLASASMEDASLPVQVNDDESPTESRNHECTICCSNLMSEKTLTLPCGHEFHADCVRTWLRMQQTCPECRVAARHAI